MSGRLSPIHYANEEEGTSRWLDRSLQDKRLFHPGSEWARVWSQGTGDWRRDRRYVLLLVESGGSLFSYYSIALYHTCIHPLLPRTPSTNIDSLPTSVPLPRPGRSKEQEPKEEV